MPDPPEDVLSITWYPGTWYPGTWYPGRLRAGTATHALCISMVGNTVAQWTGCKRRRSPPVTLDRAALSTTCPPAASTGADLRG